MANCRERRDPDPGAKSRDAPSHDEGLGTRDARAPPPTCGPRPAARVMRAAGARSGEATGTGGSGRSLLASANRRPARQPPRGRDTREPDHAGLPGIPGGRRPRGNLTRVVSSDMSARPPQRRDSTCRTSRAASCPCPRTGTAPSRTWPGPPLGDGPPNASRHPGLERGRARGVLRHLGRRAPSWSSTGGGGACRTQARRPKDPSWTPSSRMGQTRQAICWTLC